MSADVADGARGASLPWGGNSLLALEIVSSRPEMKGGRKEGLWTFSEGGRAVSAGLPSFAPWNTRQLYYPEWGRK
jgi:hypothetical protein